MIYSAVNHEFQTRISAPSLMGNGHTTTNLARKQIEWLLREQSPSIVNSNFLELSKNQITHIGNNMQSSELLLNYLETHRSNIVLILHDLYLLDLFRYVISVREFRRRFITSLGPLNFIELVAILKRDMEEKSPNKRALNAVESLKILDKKNSHIIHHCSKALYAGIEGRFKSSQLSRMDLPIGYHYFPVGVRPNKKDSTMRILLSGTDSPTKKTHEIVEALMKIADNSETKINIIGGIVKNPSIKKLKEKNIKVFLNNDDHSWVKAHEESDVCIRLGVGLNGESSGVIRDALSMGLEVIGDEESQSLAHFAAYNYADNLNSAESINSELLKVRRKMKLGTPTIPSNHQSLESYFTAIMRVFK